LEFWEKGLIGQFGGIIPKGGEFLLEEFNGRIDFRIILFPPG